MNLKLQIRARNGRHVLTQLTPDSTLKELKLLSSEVTNVPVYAMKIFHGYPPTQLNPKSDSDTLGSLSLKSGDMLIIEEDPNAVATNLPTTDSSTSMECETQNHSTTNSGILTKRVVPADNSCLFTSVDFVMNDGKKIDLGSGKALRRIISQIVAGDLNFYSPGFLGKSNADYCSWILENNSWGGAIEISILSEHFQVEIDVIDTQTGRINRFGEDKKHSHRVFLIYDGVHYDPIVLENFDGTSVIQTKFCIDDDAFLKQALEIGAEAKSSRQFTNIESGTMKCAVCDVYVCGEVGLKKHLMETGHTNFKEV